MFNYYMYNVFVVVFVVVAIVTYVHVHVHAASFRGSFFQTVIKRNIYWIIE